jgi:hypothetical protein
MNATSSPRACSEIMSTGRVRTGTSGHRRTTGVRRWRPLRVPESSVAQITGTTHASIAETTAPCLVHRTLAITSGPCPGRTCAAILATGPSMHLLATRHRVRVPTIQTTDTRRTAADKETLIRNARPTPTGVITNVSSNSTRSGLAMSQPFFLAKRRIGHLPGRIRMPSQ